MGSVMNLSSASLILYWQQTTVEYWRNLYAIRATYSLYFMSYLASAPVCLLVPVSRSLLQATLPAPKPNPDSLSHIYKNAYVLISLRTLFPEPGIFSQHHHISVLKHGSTRCTLANDWLKSSSQLACLCMLLMQSNKLKHSPRQSLLLLGAV